MIEPRAFKTELHPQPALFLFFYFELRVPLSCPRWVQICDPPASATEGARIRGVYHYVRLIPCSLGEAL